MKEVVAYGVNIHSNEITVIYSIDGVGEHIIKLPKEIANELTQAITNAINV